MIQHVSPAIPRAQLASTGGNLAFPFTPPEVAAGTAYRFNAYHVMDVDNLEPLFPVSIEDL